MKRGYDYDTSNRFWKGPNQTDQSNNQGYGQGYDQSTNQGYSQGYGQGYEVGQGALEGGNQWHNSGDQYGVQNQGQSWNEDQSFEPSMPARSTQPRFEGQHGNGWAGGAGGHGHVQAKKGRHQYDQAPHLDRSRSQDQAWDDPAYHTAEQGQSMPVHNRGAKRGQSSFGRGRGGPQQHRGTFGRGRGREQPHDPQPYSGGREAMSGPGSRRDGMTYEPKRDQMNHIARDRGFMNESRGFEREEPRGLMNRLKRQIGSDTFYKDTDSERFSDPPSYRDAQPRGDFPSRWSAKRQRVDSRTPFDEEEHNTEEEVQRDAQGNIYVYKKQLAQVYYANPDHADIYNDAVPTRAGFKGQGQANAMRRMDMTHQQSLMDRPHPMELNRFPLGLDRGPAFDRGNRAPVAFDRSNRGKGNRNRGRSSGAGKSKANNERDAARENRLKIDPRQKNQEEQLLLATDGYTKEQIAQVMSMKVELKKKLAIWNQQSIKSTSNKSKTDLILVEALWPFLKIWKFENRTAKNTFLNCLKFTKVPLEHDIKEKEIVTVTKCVKGGTIWEGKLYFNGVTQTLIATSEKRKKAQLEQALFKMVLDAAREGILPGGGLKLYEPMGHSDGPLSVKIQNLKESLLTFTFTEDNLQDEQYCASILFKALVSSKTDFDIQQYDTQFVKLEASESIPMYNLYTVYMDGWCLVKLVTMGIVKSSKSRTSKVLKGTKWTLFAKPSRQNIKNGLYYKVFKIFYYKTSAEIEDLMLASPKRPANSICSSIHSTMQAYPQNEPTKQEKNLTIQEKNPTMQDNVDNKELLFDCLLQRIPETFTSISATRTDHNGDLKSVSPVHVDLKPEKSRKYVHEFKPLSQEVGFQDIFKDQLGCSTVSRVTDQYNRYLHQKEGEMQEFIWVCFSLTLSLQVKVTEIKNGEEQGAIKFLNDEKRVHQLHTRYLKAMTMEKEQEEENKGEEEGKKGEEEKTGEEEGKKGVEKKYKCRVYLDKRHLGTVTNATIIDAQYGAIRTAADILVSCGGGEGLLRAHPQVTEVNDAVELRPNYLKPHQVTPSRTQADLFKPNPGDFRDNSNLVDRLTLPALKLRQLAHMVILVNAEYFDKPETYAYNILSTSLARCGCLFEMSREAVFTKPPLFRCVFKINHVQVFSYVSVTKRKVFSKGCAKLLWEFFKHFPVIKVSSLSGIASRPSTHVVTKAAIKAFSETLTQEEVTEAMQGYPQGLRDLKIWKTYDDPERMFAGYKVHLTRFFSKTTLAHYSFDCLREEDIEERLLIKGLALSLDLGIFTRDFFTKETPFRFTVFQRLYPQQILAILPPDQQSEFQYSIVPPSEVPGEGDLPALYYQDWSEDLNATPTPGKVTFTPAQIKEFKVMQDAEIDPKHLAEKKEGEKGVGWRMEELNKDSSKEHGDLSFLRSNQSGDGDGENEEGRALYKRHMELWEQLLLSTKKVIRKV